MRVLARVLVGVGVFLLVAAVLAVTWAPGMVKKTPLDVNTRTVYEGSAAKLDTATGAFDPQPVYAIQTTKADSAKSSDSTVLFVETTCLVFGTVSDDSACVDGDDPNLVTAEIDVFATDRVTALGTDDKNLPADAIVHEGLINKFPFDAGKKTYPYWDGLLEKATDMTYDGEETIDGLKTYRYVATVADAQVEVIPDTEGTYDNVTTVNVDPTTGAIVRGAQDQQRYLADGTQILDVDIAWTDDTIATAVDDADANGQSLKLLLTIIPIVGFVGGALALLVGVLLLLRGRNRTTPAHAQEREKVSLTK